MVPEKTCGCGAALSPRTRTGLCKTCRERAWYRANHESERARDRAYKAAHRERARAVTKAWRKANPDKVREYDELDKQTGRVKAWVAANPDKVRSAQAVDRARKRQLFVERVYAAVVWKRDKGICHLCLQPADPADWHLEHVISMLDGGPHCYANTAVAHPVCNSSKRASSWSSDGVRWSEALAAYAQFHGREFTSAT